MRKKTSKKSTTLGQGLIDGLNDAIAWHKGEKELRVTDVKISPPPVFSSKKVRALRESFNMSQPVFAKILGYSPGSVKSWEQGLTKPSQPARRILQILSTNKEIVNNIVVDNEAS